MLPPFELHRPTTVESALQLRARLGDSCLWYAGGTALLLLMKMGLAEPAALVDVKRIDGLGRIAADGSELSIGAAACYQDVIDSPAVAAGWPALKGVVREVGNARVRSTGTVCGNLAFANPRSDPLVFLLACGASLRLRSHAGARDVPLERFVLDSFTTDIADGELITEIRVPSWDAAGYVRFKPVEQEYPLIGIGIAARVDGGAFRGAPRIAVGAAGSAPVVCQAAAGELSGAAFGDADAVRRAAETAADEVAPVSGVMGSAEYIAHMIASLLPDAVGRLAGGTDTRGWA
jgi:carbon-monoxide dehydrogenase medium subunit